VVATPDELSAIQDPLERAYQAHQAQEEWADLSKEALDIRDEAIKSAYQVGVAKSDVAHKLGLSRQRIGQLLDAQSGPGPERAFWGAHKGTLIVAVGGKTEAPKEGNGPPGPVVAVEDLAAFSSVRDAVEPLGIHACHEVIQPPGLVDLNRAGLVVVCGPRLSPLVAQVLASDRNLVFEHDDDCWFLKDRRADVTLRSPINSGENADVGYLGRLPRPDGQGTFLYVAGIHAVGAPGVIHYLSESLSEVWSKVKDRRFSCLVRCTFDPETRTVLSSERVTDFYEGN
jgi:hypothetical protein